MVQQQHMTVEEYLELERNSPGVRYEYHDGWVTMMAGGILNHNRISFTIAKILDGLLSDGSCIVYTSDSDFDSKLALSSTHYIYPDVTVTCDTRDRGNVDAILSPRLIVEVLSPGTEARDRGEKFAWYRELATIQEYVLVNAREPLIDVFRREKAKLWTLHIFGPEDDVLLASLNIRFSLSDLYKGITFGDE